MHLSSLKRRFMMKYMAGALTATSDTERDRQRQLALRTMAERGTPLPLAALSFCRSQGASLSDADILTAFFGIGRERLFHAESLLMGIDLVGMVHLDDLLQARARETAKLLPEHLRPSLDKFAAEERQHYHLWLMSHPPGSEHAQSLVISSLRHALHRIIEALAYEHLRALIPAGEAMGNSPSTGGLQAPSQESLPGLNAIHLHLGPILEEHVTGLTPIYEGPGGLIIGDGTLPHDSVSRRAEYIVLNPEAHNQVRLAHFEEDLRAGVASTPYPVWEADVRKRSSKTLRAQLKKVVAHVTPAAGGKVVSMAEYRFARTHGAVRHHGAP